jgi:hypothetical protein
MLLVKLEYHFVNTTASSHKVPNFLSIIIIIPKTSDAYEFRDMAYWAAYVEGLFS